MEGFFFASRRDIFSDVTEKKGVDRAAEDL